MSCLLTSSDYAEESGPKATYPHLRCPESPHVRRQSQADWWPPPRSRKGWRWPGHWGCSRYLCLYCSLCTLSPDRTTCNTHQRREPVSSNKFTSFSLLLLHIIKDTIHKWNTLYGKNIQNDSKIPRVAQHLAHVSQGENCLVSCTIEIYIQEGDGRPTLMPATSLIKIPNIIRNNKSFCSSYSLLPKHLIAYKITCKAQQGNYAFLLNQTLKQMLHRSSWRNKKESIKIVCVCV